MEEIKNTAQLRKFLLCEMQGLISGKREAKDLLALSRTAAEVIRSSKLDLDAAKFFGKSSKRMDVGNETLLLA